MKIYVDLVFFINFFFDFLILLTVKIVLKKDTSIKKILLGSIIGGLSIFFLFIKLNSFSLFLLKVFISLLMIRVSFRWINIKTFFIDLLYLYFISIILGGFLYYLNLEFSYKNNGLVFFHNGYSINFIILFILSPIIFYIYIKQNKNNKQRLITNYNVCFNYNKKTYYYNAYLDTGNKLYDLIGKPIILLYDKNFKLLSNTKITYARYQTLEHTGIIKCFKVKSITIDNKIYNNILIGLSREPFKINGINMILHPDLFI